MSNIIYTDWDEWLEGGEIGDIWSVEGYEPETIQRVDIVRASINGVSFEDRWVLTTMSVEDTKDGLYWLYYNPAKELTWEGTTEDKESWKNGGAVPDEEWDREKKEAEAEDELLDWGD